MPVYLDHHRVPQLSQEDLSKVVADMKAGKTTNGITPLNGFIGANDAWCLIDAPNADAVHNLHKAAYGLELGPGDVTEVQKLV